MFEHLRSYRIPSLNLEAQEYRHAGTGARHLHLAANDDNNAFLLAFQTSRPSGLDRRRAHPGAHRALRQRALPGARPVFPHDPAFAQYLHERLHRQRLDRLCVREPEPQGLRQPAAGLSRRRVLPRFECARLRAGGPSPGYRGARQSRQRAGLQGRGLQRDAGRARLGRPRLWHALAAELYPTTTYHHNSGGEPRRSPSSPVESLREFHRRHYHPSNACFGTYGDFDPREHQAKFDKSGHSGGSRPGRWTRQ